MPTLQNHWKSRLIAATVHLGISLGLAALAAALVFGIWYPYPYREISGGRELFLLIVSVDVVMGPLLTLAVFNQSKPFQELRRDLAIIAVMQLAALSYGLWTVAVARPVHLVFEVDRFRVVHAIEVDAKRLSAAPPQWQKLPLTGPTLASLRDFKNTEERTQLTFASVDGVELSERPDMWQSYEKAKAQIIARALPLEDLKKRFPNRATEIDKILKAASQNASQNYPAGSVIYLPVASRNSTFWTALLDKQTTEVITFVPLDPF